MIIQTEKEATLELARAIALLAQAIQAHTGVMYEMSKPVEETTYGEELRKSVTGCGDFS